MSIREQPLVSVVTPVYNGEAYLEECLDSVLKQTYSNWEYIIVDNFSTDRTSEIAKRYAVAEKRIRVHRNEKLLDIIANHNKAFSLLSPYSRYCKVVSADDWLYSECVEKMVALAEANPSVSLIGSYQLSGGGDEWYVRNDGLPYHKTVFPGREICRSQLLGTSNVFGNPTSDLYRSDLVRSSESFYPNATAEADTSACFKCLQGADFGFVHQVLSYERLHEVRVTSTSLNLNAYISARISDCLSFGPSCLTPDELEARLKTLLDQYYKFLAKCVGRSRGKAFWDYHQKRLCELGYPLDRIRLEKAVLARMSNLMLNPGQTFVSLFRHLHKQQNSGPATAQLKPTASK